MLTIIILVKLASDIGGNKTGVYMALLLAFSAVMIDHGRQFWNPYLIQLFLSLWLFCVWHAFSKKNITLLWIGTLSFVIALSIYPSPVLLIPCCGYQLFYWYRKIAKKSPTHAFSWSIITFFLTGIAVYAPQIIYEITHSLPSLKTLMSSAERASTPNVISAIWVNLQVLITTFLSTDHLPTVLMAIITIGMIALFVKLLFSVNSAHLTPLCTPLTASIGFILFLFYPYDVSPHRTWAILPLLFLLTAIVLDQAFQKDTNHRILVGILLLTYVVCNISGTTAHFQTYLTNNDIPITQQVAKTISEDMKNRGLSEQTAGIFYKIPNDPKNGSYEIFRILYWLLDSRVFTIPLIPKGNLPQFDYSVPLLKPYMYVICQEFPSQSSAYQSCVLPTIGSHHYQLLRVVSIVKTRVFVLFDNTDILNMLR